MTDPLNCKATQKVESVRFKWVLNLTNTDQFKSKKTAAHHQSKHCLESFTFYFSVIADAFPGRRPTLLFLLLN